MDYASMTLVGRIARDVRFVQGDPEKKVDDRAFTAVAVNRPGSSGKCDFHNIIAWGAQAKVLRDYTYKGKQVTVSGCPQTYEKDIGGQKITVTELVVEKIVLGADTQAVREQKAAGTTNPTEKLSAPAPTEEEAAIAQMVASIIAQKRAAAKTTTATPQPTDDDFPYA